MCDNTNLKDEVLDALESNGLTGDDVIYVSYREYGDSKFYKTSFAQFLQVAAYVDYDSGFGGHEINENLEIVGDDWWMERSEYDGSEWWSFKRKKDDFFVEKEITADSLYSEFHEKRSN